MEDIRQTLGWSKYLTSKGWVCETVESGDRKHQIRVAILPLGILGLKMMKIQRAGYDPDWKKLKKLKRKYGVVSSIIEPLEIQEPAGYFQNGYKLSKFPYLATSTYLMDLKRSVPQLWRGLSDNTRRLIQKNGDVVIEECDLNLFFDLWKKNSKVWTLSKKDLDSLVSSMGKDVRLVVSKRNDEYHSGLLVIYSKDTANYYQTWTSARGRESGAHYKLVWEEVLRAKRDGKSFFDFEGVYDSRWPQKRWLGFSEFKRRFGGRRVFFPGCYFRWL